MAGIEDLREKRKHDSLIRSEEIVLQFANMFESNYKALLQ